MEEIGRLLRQVNDAAESLDHERGDEADGFDFRVRRGLRCLGYVTSSSYLIIFVSYRRHFRSCI